MPHWIQKQNEKVVQEIWLDTLEDLQTLQCTTQKNWYKHKPQSVLETDNATILWDFAMHTDRKLIVVDITIKIKNYKINSCLLIKLMFLMDKKQSGG